MRNIFKELEKDVGAKPSNHLENWAQQGVLLLNCSLTVKKRKPGLHMKYWKPFTDEIIQKLSNENKNIVFLLWGKFAQEKEGLICKENEHLILKASHPSPLSAWRGGWFGQSHFSKTNEWLKSKGIDTIKW